MALPKRRHSRSRQKKRRTHQGIEKLSLSLCPQCKKPKLSHHICPHCGYYKGKPVIVIKKKEPKKK